MPQYCPPPVWEPSSATLETIRVPSTDCDTCMILDTFLAREVSRMSTFLSFNATGLHGGAFLPRSQD
nr:hypothetical protein CFP56_28749 [Quercus suber]